MCSDRLGVNDDSISPNCSRREGDFGVPVSTSSTSAVPLDDDGNDLLHGWKIEGKLAIDEAGQFDDVVSFLDEGQSSKIVQRTERWTSGCARQRVQEQDFPRMIMMVEPLRCSSITL